MDILNRNVYILYKQELQELLIELKTAIKINNIPKDETECGVNLVNECAKCNSLLFQLQEAILKHKMTQFIIKVLQDELNKSGNTHYLIGSDKQNICETSRNGMMSILIKQGSVLHIQVIMTLELSRDMKCYQKYTLNQMKSQIKFQC